MAYGKHEDGNNKKRNREQERKYFFELEVQ
jgi:hypothetical protein